MVKTAQRITGTLLAAIEDAQKKRIVPQENNNENGIFLTGNYLTGKTTYPTNPSDHIAPVSREWPTSG